MHLNTTEYLTMVTLCMVFYYIFAFIPFERRENNIKPVTKPTSGPLMRTIDKSQSRVLKKII